MIKFKDFFLLKEGGNVFKTHPTSRISLQHIPQTLSFLSSIVGWDVSKNLLGSTGKKPTSGDIDIAVDQQKISKKNFEQLLIKWCEDRNLNPKDYVAKSGISVHFRTPIANTEDFVQTDFMFYDDVNFAQFAASNDETPPLKGVHRHMVLSNLAKNLGYKWSVTAGLKSRQTDQVIESHNPDNVARLILNDKSATAKNIINIPAIFEFLKRKYSVDMIQDMVREAHDTILKEGIDIYDQL
jgi:hypothetical protein